MAWNADAKARAEALATREGLTGNTKARRMAELREQMRPPTVQENARDFAFLGTFNNDVYGVLGALTDAITNATQRVPALKLIIPFTRIVGDVGGTTCIDTGGPDANHLSSVYISSGPLLSVV